MMHSFLLDDDLNATVLRTASTGTVVGDRLIRANPDRRYSRRCDTVARHLIGHGGGAQFRQINDVGSLTQ